MYTSKPTSPSMSDSTSSLGACPLCSSPIPHGAVLIRYKVDGAMRLFAECTDCGEPVRPK